MRLIEFLAASKSSRVIVITESVIPVFTKRYSIPIKKFEVISTCVDTDVFKMQDLPQLEEIKILLSGTFSSAYDLEKTNSIIKCFREFLPTRVTVAVSPGATNNWKLIDFDDVVTSDFTSMPELISEHHLGLSIIRENLGISLKSIATTKTAEFLSVGRPIIVNLNQGDIGGIVDKFNVGVATWGNDSNSLREEVEKMMRILETRGIETKCNDVAREFFSLEKGVEKLIQIYKDLDGN